MPGVKLNCDDTIYDTICDDVYFGVNFNCDGANLNEVVNHENEMNKWKCYRIIFGNLYVVE